MGIINNLEHFAGEQSVDVQELSEEIVGRLPMYTNQPFEIAENEGFKRADVLASVAEFARSKEFEALNVDDKTHYQRAIDLLGEKNPKLAKAVGNYHMSMLVLVARAMKENKEYIPAIEKFLEKPENWTSSEKYDGLRLADFIRMQLDGKLAAPTKLKAILRKHSKGIGNPNGGNPGH